MSHKHKKVRAAVRRDHAESYILTSLVAFAVMVSLVSRPYYSLIALASVLFVLFADYWNMLGWRF